MRITTAKFYTLIRIFGNCIKFNSAPPVKTLLNVKVFSGIRETAQNNNQSILPAHAYKTFIRTFSLQSSA